MTRELRAQWSLLGLGMALSVATLLSLGVGPMSISLSQSLQALLHGLGVGGNETIPAHVTSIIETIRLPRTVLAMLVGAALAVSGGGLAG